jgi:hypothetical protein
MTRRRTTTPSIGSAAVRDGSQVAAFHPVHSYSRPESTSPRPDGSTRRGSSPGHPIPPTAPWPGTEIRDASPRFAVETRRDVDSRRPAGRWSGFPGLR